jgi:hypothetical protein
MISSKVERIDEDYLTCEKTITYKKRTCRDIFVIVAYKTDEPELIDYIRIVSSSKEGGCPVSFLESFSDMLTFSVRRIRNIHEAKQIVKNLRGQKCLQCPPNQDHITSCSDAIGQVLQKVLRTDEQKTL